MYKASASAIYAGGVNSQIGLSAPPGRVNNTCLFTPPVVNSHRPGLAMCTSRRRCVYSCLAIRTTGRCEYLLSLITNK